VEESRNDIAAELARVTACVLDQSQPAELLATRLRQLAEQLEARGQLTLTPTTPTNGKMRVIEKENVRRVFDYWRERTGHGRAQATPERMQKIAARLRQGYSVQTICKAIDGCAASDFYAGKYDDITLICRNGSKLESFAAMGGDAMGASSPTEVDRLREQLRKAAEEGDTDAYDRTNEQLRAAMQGARR